MKELPILNSEILKQHRIKIFEPFSAFLQGDEEEYNFEISLLDVVRFAGHACPSMIGAFLMAKAAVEALYPDDKTCRRGDLEIDIPYGPTDGATGPMANVFSFITGAWGETGFGGLQGQFARRNLIRFNSSNVPERGYRFTRISTHQSVDVLYEPNQADVRVNPSLPFQTQWRYKISAILDNAEKCVQVSGPAREDFHKQSEFMQSFRRT